MDNDFIYVDIKFVSLDLDVCCWFSTHLTIKQNLSLVLEMIEKQAEILLNDIIIYESYRDYFLNGDIIIKNLTSLNKLMLYIF